MAYIDKNTGLVVPGTLSSDSPGGGGGSSVDLSFITAGAADILSGKVGSDQSGKPIAGTLTISPSGGSGSFDLAKVTEYTPATDAFSGISKIAFSGFGDGYSGANGTYDVTTETQSEADPWQRVYKHPSGNWYFWGSWDDEYEEGVWYIGPAPGSGVLACYAYDELSSGEYGFENWDSGDYYDVNLAVTKTNYPAADMVLKGVLATAYTDGEWSFGSTEQSFTGFGRTPVRNYLYVASGNTLVGRALGYLYDIDIAGQIFYDPLNGVNPGVPDVGPAYDEGNSPSYTVIDEVQCAEFNVNNQIKSSDCANFPANGFTLSIWMHKRGATAPENVFGFGRDGQYAVCMLRSDGSSTGYIGIERGSGQIYTNVSMMDGRWHHCLCTIGATGSNAIWVDGIKVHTFTQQFNVDPEKVGIGSWINNNNNRSMYLASARIFDRVLTDSEIQQLATEF